MNREQSIEFIQAIEDTKALERAILDIIDELKSEGSKEIADGLEQLIPISNNRFSVIGQKELLQESKRRAISILKSEPQFNHVSEKEACCIVERVLGNVQLYLQDMFKRQPHTKCTDSILSMQKRFDIGNEYDLQHIVCHMRGTGSSHSFLSMAMFWMQVVEVDETVRHFWRQAFL